MAKYDPKTKDDKCIFCEIVKGNIPSHVLWEDLNHIAFLSIDPNTEGVTVVIPKEHFDSNPLELPDDELKELILASRKVAIILEKYFSDVGRVGFIIEGMGINHAHIKLYPMHGTQNLKNGNWEQYVSSHKEEWLPKYNGSLSSVGGPMAKSEDLKSLAEKIRNSIIK